MADTTALKNRIRAAIKANDNQEITGPVLQQALLDIVDELDSTEGIIAEKNRAEAAESSLRQSISQAMTTAFALEQGAAMKNSNNAFSGNNIFSGDTALSDTLITGELQVNEGGIVVLSQGQTTNEMTVIGDEEVKAQSFKKWNGTNFEELATEQYVNNILGNIETLLNAI